MTIKAVLNGTACPGWLCTTSQHAERAQESLSSRNERRQRVTKKEGIGYGLFEGAADEKKRSTTMPCPHGGQEGGVSGAEGKVGPQ